jgi:regulatory protein
LISETLAAADRPEDILDHPGDPHTVARTICLHALTQRARTRAELSALLARRGVPNDAATAVLDRFSEVGLIDDLALAETFASAAHHERGLSRRAVAAKLRLRGVDEPAVQAAVDQIDSDSELAAARDLAVRRLRSLRDLDPAVQARRIVGLLARRGYSPGLAYRVARDVISDPETLPVPGHSA